jgi:drug/metabolite transporter (DMT)-like permease
MTWFHKLPPNIRGILLMSVSALCYAVMTAIVRGLRHDFHFTEVVFFRLAFGVFAMAPVLVKGGLAGMKTARVGRYVYRAGLQGAAMACYYLGLALLPLAMGVSLYNLTAIFIAVIAIFVLGEPSVLGRWLVVALGLGGALVVVRPTFEGVDFGALLVIASCLLYAIYQVDAKVLSRTEPVPLIVFWTMVLSAPMALAVAVFFWTWPSLEQLFWLFIMGTSGTFANWAMTQAYKIGEMTAIAPVSYTQMVWAGVFGFLVFSEVPDLYMWIGAAMIAAAGILLSQMEARRARLKVAAQTA